MNGEEQIWDNVKLPPNEDRIWELYHENSKRTPYTDGLAGAEKMPGKFLPSLIRPSITTLKLPEDVALPALSSDRLLRFEDRPLSLQGRSMNLEMLAALMGRSCGAYAGNLPFRRMESSLYVLEINFFATRIEKLEAGLYHYRPEEGAVALEKEGGLAKVFGKSLDEVKDWEEASMLVFLSVPFGRLTRHFGERGYRLALIECGRIFQNISLVSATYDLACLPMDEYFDRGIEQVLNIDGVDHSLLEVIAIG